MVCSSLWPLCSCLHSLLFPLLLLLSGFHLGPLCPLCPHSYCRCGCCTALRRKQNRCSRLLGQLVRPAPPTYGSRWVRLCPSWAWPDYPIAFLQSDRRAGGTSLADESPVGCPSLPTELSRCARTTEPLEDRTSSLTARRMGTERRGFAVEWSKRWFFPLIQDLTCIFCTERYNMTHSKQHNTFFSIIVTINMKLYLQNI